MDFAERPSNAAHLPSAPSCFVLGRRQGPPKGLNLTSECVGTNDVAHSCEDKFAQSGSAHFVIQHGPHGIGTLHSQSTIKDFFRTLA